MPRHAGYPSAKVAAFVQGPPPAAGPVIRVTCVASPVTGRPGRTQCRVGAEAPPLRADERLGFGNLDKQHALETWVDHATHNNYEGQMGTAARDRTHGGG